MMLVGALAAFAATYHTGSLGLGVLAALAAGGLLSLVHAFLAITLQANQVVGGLALTLFAQGLTAFLGQPLVGLAAPASFARWPLPVLGDLPLIGPVLFRQDLLTYLSYLLVPLLWWVLFRTRWGLYVRAVGDNPAAADAMGIPVAGLRYLCTLAGGVLAGLGGAAITLASNPGWAEDMVAGRGWIAVALVIFATWNPLRAALGAWLFGGVNALQFRLQSAGTSVSPFFLNMLPYLLTVAVLALVARGAARRRLGAPASLGLPYRREERG
jgi:simple sugar transport system permease protein